MTIIAPITHVRCLLDANLFTPFAQPDHETRHQRIRTLFARVICEKLLCARMGEFRSRNCSNCTERLVASLIQRTMSLNDRDVWLAEQEIFELALRLGKLHFEIRKNFAPITRVRCLLDANNLLQLRNRTTKLSTREFARCSRA